MAKSNYASSTVSKEDMQSNSSPEPYSALIPKKEEDYDLWKSLIESADDSLYCEFKNSDLNNSEEYEDGSDSEDEEGIKVPSKFKPMLKKYQDILTQDTDDWRVISYTNKVKISALKLKRSKVIYNISALKMTIIKCLLVFLLMMVVRMVYPLSYVWASGVCALLSY